VHTSLENDKSSRLQAKKISLLVFFYSNQTVHHLDMTKQKVSVFIEENNEVFNLCCISDSIVHVI